MDLGVQDQFPLQTQENILKHSKMNEEMNPHVRFSSLSSKARQPFQPFPSDPSCHHLTTDKKLQEKMKMVVFVIQSQDLIKFRQTTTFGPDKQYLMPPYAKAHQFKLSCKGFHFKLWRWSVNKGISSLPLNTELRTLETAANPLSVAQLFGFFKTVSV